VEVAEPTAAPQLAERLSMPPEALPQWKQPVLGALQDAPAYSLATHPATTLLAARLPDVRE
jgi:hypothetical protein